MIPVNLSESFHEPSHELRIPLVLSDLRSTYPKDRVMNLCERDGRPVQVVFDLQRLRQQRPQGGFWDRRRADLWRFGARLPLDIADPADCRHVISLRRRKHTPASLRSSDRLEDRMCH